MIELAPQHKIGLALNNPVMIASGFGGYGQVYQGIIDVSCFGAVVTQPITLRPQRGAPQPRVVETKAGFIINTGLQNPGVKNVLRYYGKIWPRVGTMLIAHLPADEVDNLTRTARALSNVENLTAFELGVPHHAGPYEVEQAVRAIQKGSELPVLVKIPLAGSHQLAEAAAYNYADALVVGTPPLGTAPITGQQNLITGLIYGPALHNLTLYHLHAVASVGLPLIAAGGIHSLSDAKAFLQAGAKAVQIDSLIFVDPKQAEAIAIQLRLEGS
jgi:dihydroorotate dehydrogenase (NAD+) catalytic subunit